MGSKNLIMKKHIEEYIKKSSENGGLCTGYFIDYRNKILGKSEKGLYFKQFCCNILKRKKAKDKNYMGVE